MFAQEAQRCDDSELSHLLSLAGQAGLADLVEARPDEPDEQRSHGLTVLLGRAGNAGERQADVGAEPFANAVRPSAAPRPR